MLYCKNKKINIMNTALINTYYKFIQLLLNIDAGRFEMFVFSFTSFISTKIISIRNISNNNSMDRNILKLLIRDNRTRWVY